ncbi:hypothetical protein KO500_00070 [Cellulophaga baltica]|uniref:hypothetical protein n=1 Tax=Cellulophaga TaxID=104264 RepID=UPI001C074F3C|nr:MULTISPECIES: hypothetical protein [Cellulophaga]MBU2994809.1 hypothetical protein [Cellulophaga baltica]MDO6766204.1 hypothetical protein [Cellulophaga sp. 1_MG-2023]
MKYIVIPYIAFGFVLSLTLGVEYICVGQEMFPDYYGSPLVFKQKSLGSSMEYFYSISGLVLNTIIWSVLIFLLRYTIHKLINKIGANKSINNIYKVIVVLLIGFSSLNILVDSAMLGSGFEEGRNFWYMDLDKEAENWGMKCDGEWKMFAK